MNLMRGSSMPKLPIYKLEIIYFFLYIVLENNIIKKTMLRHLDTAIVESV